MLGDDRFTGLTLGQPAFGAWVAEHLGVGTDDAEAAAVLRRASVIAMGRGLDMDAWTHPDDARPADESCHTYHAGVVPVSFRNVGSCPHERGRRRRRADPRRRRPGRVRSAVPRPA